MRGLALAAVRAERRHKQRLAEARREESERAKQRAEENARFAIEAEQQRLLSAEHNRQRREQEAPAIEENARLARQRRAEALWKERRERAAERERLRAEQEQREREATEREVARLREKYQPVPDTRMIELYQRIDALGLPDDVVTKFKALSGNAQRALVGTLGEHLGAALPLYFAIEPDCRAMALNYAKAKPADFIPRLRTCLPSEDF